MRETTLRERLGAWFYTGAPGRLVSFSIDLTLSLAAMALYLGKTAWGRLRSALARS